MRMVWMPGRTRSRWHLEQEGIRAPAPATISRILSRLG